MPTHTTDTTTDTTASKREIDDFGKALGSAVGKLRRDVVPSETIVLENAFFLIREGLLNIPDVGTVNVKQTHAFLWNAAWLQEYMNKRWRDEGVLPIHPDRNAKIDFADSL